MWYLTSDSQRNRKSCEYNTGAICYQVELYFCIAQTFILSRSLRPLGEIPPPNYNYREEALLVVDRLRETASSRDRKTKIRFFDNKLLVRGLL